MAPTPTPNPRRPSAVSQVRQAVQRFTPAATADPRVSNVNPTVANGLNLRQQALLDTIAGPESNGHYDMMYGGKRFSDFSWHPNRKFRIKSGPNKGDFSSAAGKYQFLTDTWNEYAHKLKLKDFSPASQDRAAWELARDVYRKKTRGGDLNKAVLSDDPNVIAGIGKHLRGTWTSLPGGIEQGTTTSRFVSTFQKNLGRGRQTVQQPQYANVPIPSSAPRLASPQPAAGGPKMAGTATPIPTARPMGTGIAATGAPNSKTAFAAPARPPASAMPKQVPQSQPITPAVSPSGIGMPVQQAAVVNPAMNQHMSQIAQQQVAQEAARQTAMQATQQTVAQEATRQAATQAAQQQAAQMAAQRTAQIAAQQQAAQLATTQAAKMAMPTPTPNPMGGLMGMMMMAMSMQNQKPPVVSPDAIEPVHGGGAMGTAFSPEEEVRATSTTPNAYDKRERRRRLYI